LCFARLKSNADSGADKDWEVSSVVVLEI